MPSSPKKVIVRLLSGGLLHGYLPAASFVRHDAPESPMVDLLDLTGRTLSTSLAGIRLISYVRDFNLDDSTNPERLTRTAFLARPRSEGLWLRITFPAGDQLEGLAPLDTSLLDALVDDSGLFLTPPDDRTNTHRVFVPRAAIAALQILSVITTPSRKPAKPVAEPQPNLFP